MSVRFQYITMSIQRRPKMASATQKPATTSPSLLIRLQNQEPDAWQHFDNIYRRYIQRWCTALQITDRDDITQQVLLKVHLAVGEFKRHGEGSFRAWLRTITIHLVSDQCDLCHLSVSPDALEQLANPTKHMLLEEDALLYEQVIASAGDIFSEKWVRCFLGMTVYGVSSTQLADELSMTTGAVRKANFKVLQRLRREFAELLDE